MYHLFNILFDDNTKEENLLFYKLEKNNNTNEYESVLFTNYGFKPIGSFLFDFINSDFKSKEVFYKFVTTYCFEALYFEYYPYQLCFPGMKYSITEKTYVELLKIFFQTYCKEFCIYSDILFDLINTKGRLDFISFIDKIPTIKMQACEYEKYNNIDIKSYLKNIELNFDYKNHFHCNYDNTEYAYSTNSSISLLFLCMWKLTKLDNVVYKCQNCGRYFIPDYKYDVRYCNYVFSDNKTCRELAPQIEYKKKLKNEPVFKKYRTFYQTLQKNASLYGGKHIIRYEDFKKEGRIMKRALKEGTMTLERFNNWLNSKKIRH